MTFPLQGANVLIVEDDFLVALEVETVLQERGRLRAPHLSYGERSAGDRARPSRARFGRDPGRPARAGDGDPCRARARRTGDAVPVLHRSGEFGSDHRRVAARQGPLEAHVAQGSARGRRPKPSDRRPRKRAERAESFEGPVRLAGSDDKRGRRRLRGRSEEMVLQERIELSTSPLPRECSTTELLQHPGAGRPKASGFCHSRRGMASR